MRPFDILAIVLGGLALLAIVIIFIFAVVCFIKDHFPRRARFSPRIPRSSL